MTALEFLKSFPHLPYDNENHRTTPSNSVLWRWLDKGSVIINGKTPKPNEEIKYPIKSLIFFPKGNTITMW